MNMSTHVSMQMPLKKELDLKDKIKARGKLGEYNNQVANLYNQYKKKEINKKEFFQQKDRLLLILAGEYAS